MAAHSNQPVHIQTQVLNPSFGGRNFLAYNFAASACAVYAIIFSIAQSVYLSNLSETSPEDSQNVSLSLNIIDQLTALLVAPFIGALSDRLQVLAWKSAKMPSGPRIMQLGGFVVVAIAFFGHWGIGSHARTSLYILRVLSAVGVASITGVTVVMLHEASNSDFTWQKLKFWARKRSEDERTLAQLQEETRGGAIAADEDSLFVEEGEEVYLQNRKRYHGKLAAWLGIFIGVGPISAMIFGAPLIALFSAKHASWSGTDFLKAASIALGVIALVSGFLVYVLGYDSIKQRRAANQNLTAGSPDATYLELLKEAVRVSLRSRKIQIAYLGGFIARSTAIATTVFTPLVVFKYYSATDSCGTAPVGQPGFPGFPGVDSGASGVSGGSAAPSIFTNALKIRADAPELNECFNALVFIGVLIGVSSVISLLSTFVWVKVVDSPRLGSSFALFAGAAMSVVGCFWLCIAGSVSTVYDPRNVWCFIAVSLIASSQTGANIASMSLITSVGSSLGDSEHRVIGSVAGLYKFLGGAGALLVAVAGGKWSEHWVFGPIFVLGLLNLALLVLTRGSIRGSR